MRFLKLSGIILTGCLLIYSCNSIYKNYDICIYGGTSAGVIAAVSAQRLGKTVILIEPGEHLGGLSSSGLGSTDIGNKHAVTGISRDFYRRLGAHYGMLESWTFEPSVAEKIFNNYIKEGKIKVLYQYRLKAIEKENLIIKKIELEPSTSTKKKICRIKAKIFIDCSYEGDLMAKAGVSYTIGRESNSEYGETLNGFQLMDGHQFEDGIDPYIIPGDSTSGLLWGISNNKPVATGTGDKRLQAYNYRLCWSSDPINQIAFSQTKPSNYDSTNFELLLRVILKRENKNPGKQTANDYFIISKMPNNKTDVNNKGPFSTDYIGMNYDYPEADYATREKIAKEHANYIKGLLYFLSTDKRIPDKLQKDIQKWGWAKDEFTWNNNFPHQLYVREARRMIGEYVMTEHNCVGDSIVNDGIALAAYTMDSHNCQRLVKNGMVKNEGNVEVGNFPPYQISYRSITPKRTECTNLLVPVCMSATHIAYGSIRMEPVFMVLAQISAMAGVMAIQNNTVVQEIDVPALIKLYNENPLLNGNTPDILVDNFDSSNVLISGNWQITSKWMGQYKTNYHYCFPTDTSTSFTFIPEIKTTGNYDIYFYVPLINNQVINQLASKIKATIEKKSSCVELKNTKTWIYLGQYNFISGNKPNITISPIIKDSAIVADAILLVPIINNKK